MKAMFFVDSKELSVDVYVVYREEDGLIISASGLPIGEELVEGIVEIKYTFYFTKPNFDDMSKYRQLSMYVDKISGKTIVNPFKLRNYIILNHLKRWTGVTDSEGNDIELTLDPDGTLSATSLDLIYNINPSIMDVVMSLFEQKAMIF